MSSYVYTPHILPMLAVAVFVTVMGCYSWRHRSVPGALPFTILMSMYWLWAVGTALEMAATDASAALFWFKFEGVWKLPTVTALLWFVLECANLDRWLTRRKIILLSIPPILALLLILTNDAHGLIWVGPAAGGVAPLLRGSWTWAFTGYGLVLTFACTAVFACLFTRSSLHRWPIALCLFGQLVTLVAYLFDLSNAHYFAPMQATLLAGTFAAVMYAIALFRFGMFDLVPIARATMIEQMREGMLVLDSQRRIVDLNHAAEEILGVSAALVKGRDAVQVLPPYCDLRTLLTDSGPAHYEICTGTDDAARWYALQLSPLRYRRGISLGSLILFHDITGQKRVQAEHLEQQRAIAALRERHQVARELHDSLGQVLGYVKLQVQAARELLKQDRLPEADHHLAQLAGAVQEAHADVREYILGARVGFDAEAGFFPVLREYLQQFSENYGIATQLDVPPDMAKKALEPTAEAQLLRVIQEALTNVRKHARADGVRVSFSSYDGHAQAIVQDSGRGFDPALFETAEGQRFGLRFMRERAAEVGGSVRIHSAPGKGTEVIICIPLRRGM